LNREEIDDQTINKRVTKARRIIACLNGILWSKHNTKNRKFNIYETMIKSIMLYRCKPWRIKKEATEHWKLQRWQSNDW